MGKISDFKLKKEVLSSSLVSDREPNEITYEAMVEAENDVMSKSFDSIKDLMKDLDTDE